jgi:hypothetical protein
LDGSAVNDVVPSSPSTDKAFTLLLFTLKRATRLADAHGLWDNGALGESELQDPAWN